ncbi:PREDICTED: inositol monophosphatase 1-like [Priapulus caudatus]|uniref:Inositol monophosphatase 1-like n=1 Tax=Priapulus caudatus TaxID=37621 RepID=A0ABM1ER46_PRICU|nr:PREDICTED: inositol monophosphatase 1-like [Priapulus caudatus]
MFFPHVAISIALAVQKELELGIIHDVYNNKTYIGRRGKGAYYDGERLQVTPVQDLKEAMIISELGSSRDVAHMDKVFRNLRNVGSGCRGMRCLGSAALNMCLVAKGISHSYYEYGIHCWDIAAGALIVREAGGVVLDPNGGPLNLMSRRVLCGSDVSLCSQISSRLTHIDLEHD